MKRAFLLAAAPFDTDDMFREESPLNRDDSLAFLRELKDVFEQRGVSLASAPYSNIPEADFFIYNEMPPKLPIDSAGTSLFLYECEVIRPDNWDLKRHAHFEKIFTWNDALVDNKKYFKFNFTGPHSSAFPAFREREKFCTLIAGNKRSSHPNELYSERLKTIEWFEKNQPTCFDLYGVGWDISHYTRVFRRWGLPLSIPAAKRPSYRGKVDSKLNVLTNYKFNICYENAQEITGYVTEKIHDSFTAGCVPIYWGAPNIKELIPGNCFIDRREFSDNQSLFDFMSRMSEKEYTRIQENMKDYMAKDKQYHPRACAEKVVKDILGD